MAHAIAARASLGHRRDAPNNFRGSAEMENLFDTEVGLALAGLLALLGYLGLLIEHPKPERQKKRERIAHRALVLAAVIELACALATVAAAHGWHPFPVHRFEAPIDRPKGDIGPMAETDGPRS